jgi:hypothetical protein
MAENSFKREPSPPPPPPRAEIGVEDYLRDRLEDQLGWYDRKSVAAQRRFKWLRGVEIVLAALLPLLTVMSSLSRNPLVARVQPWVVAGVGVGVAIIAGVLSMNQYQEHWIKYRTTAESLKHEKFRFLTRAEPYDGDGAFALLVSRVESLISQENSAWAQLASSAQRARDERAPEEHRED